MLNQMERKFQKLGVDNYHYTRWRSLILKWTFLKSKGKNPGIENMTVAHHHYDFLFDWIIEHTKAKVDTLTGNRGKIKTLKSLKQQIQDDIKRFRGNYYVAYLELIRLVELVSYYFSIPVDTSWHSKDAFSPRVTREVESNINMGRIFQIPILVIEDIPIKRAIAMRYLPITYLPLYKKNVDLSKPGDVTRSWGTPHDELYRQWMGQDLLRAQDADVLSSRLEESMMTVLRFLNEDRVSFGKHMASKLATVEEGHYRDAFEVLYHRILWDMKVSSFDIKKIQRTLNKLTAESPPVFLTNTKAAHPHLNDDVLQWSLTMLDAWIWEYTQ